MINMNQCINILMFIIKTKTLILMKQKFGYKQFNVIRKITLQKFLFVYNFCDEQDIILIESSHNDFH